MRNIFMVIKGFKIVPLNIFARKARKVWYWFTDLLGFILFWPFTIGSIPPPEEIKKILLIRIDNIGDMVLTTPAIAAVRKRYPQARIDILLACHTQDILVTNSNIDRILVRGQDCLDRPTTWR